MELITEITEKNIGIGDKTYDGVYVVRKAARSIVFNSDGQIALLYVSKDNYHKLPGGGIEEGEDIPLALAREVMEEVGAKVEVLGEVGVVIEYTSNPAYKEGQVQLTYCYYSKVIGELGETSFTELELSNGFILKWVDFSEAIKLLEQDVPNTYGGKFIRARDLAILKRAAQNVPGTVKSN